MHLPTLKASASSDQYSPKTKNSAPAAHPLFFLNQQCQRTIPTAKAVSCEAVCAPEVSGVYAPRSGLSKPKIKKLKACSQGQTGAFCKACPITVHHENIIKLYEHYLSFFRFGPIQVTEVWIKPFPKGTWINVRSGYA